MMMETAVYTRQFLYARALRDHGELGRIQFLRGAHYQDMERWPTGWVCRPCGTLRTPSARCLRLLMHRLRRRIVLAPA